MKLLCVTTALCMLYTALCFAAPLKITAKLVNVEACSGRFTCYYFKITPPPSRGEQEETAFTYRRNIGLFVDKAALTLDLQTALVTNMNTVYPGATFDITDIVIVGW